MKYLFLLFWVGLAGAQEPPAEPPKTAPARETDEQKTTRAVSLRDLEDAEEKINQERETHAKARRRIDMLLEDLENRVADIENKTTNLQQKLDDAKKKDQGNVGPISQIQIDHWNSRDPVVAANDFILLYNEEPEVGVNLVKGMKKKKSAALIDEVSKIGENGVKVAARLHEAIGTGRLDKDN